MNRKRIASIFSATLLLLSMLLCAVACQQDPADDPQKDGEDLGTYTVQYQGTVITLGKDASAVLKALGEPTAKQFVASCGDGAGDQWRYTYSSIYLFTVKTDEGETVDAIALRDDIAKTGKGITVGSTEAEMTAAYGEPTAKQENNYRYINGNQTMEFQMNDAGVIAMVEMRIES